MSDIGCSNGTIKKTILVVDDNPALLRSLERLLSLEGFEVWTAQDGDAGLRHLEFAQRKPDLIISDIAMPVMDGFEFFEMVRRREEWLDIPFLFLTARDQREDLRRGYELGADDYLVKPLDEERLLLVIHSKIKRHAEMMSHIEMQQHNLETAKRQLSMMVAHELRTPLVSIGMVTDILSREVGAMETGQVQEMLTIMQNGSIRLTRLVEQMVMYVQLQSGALASAIRANARPRLMHEIVQGAIARAKEFDFQQREVPVEVDEAAPEAVVSGDVGALKHALAELISNAVMFSREGGTVEIAQYLSGDTIWITVTDHGYGIPEEELERVFQPYYQVDRQRYEQQGIGIGLTLARGIVEAHAGELTLRSWLNRGTQAIMRLPAWEGDLTDL